MISLYLLMLAVTFVSADQLEWFRHGTIGVEQIVIKYNDKKKLLYANTNEFQEKYPARIGFFETRIVEKTDVLAGLRDAKNKSPEKYLVSPHVAKIFFNNKEVLPTHSQYLLAKRIIASEIASGMWEIIDGREVDFSVKNKLTVNKWKLKKKLLSQQQSPSTVCKQKGEEKICLFKEGFVYPPLGYEWLPVKL